MHSFCVHFISCAFNLLFWLKVRSLNIRQATAADADAIAEIYNWYVANTIITFETEAVEQSEMQQRIRENNERYHWLVGEVDREVIGYAYYGSFRTRAAYNHTVESTVYLKHTCFGKGFGTLLYRELIESAKQREFREMIGVIALPNSQSVALHQKMEFIEVGFLKNVGYKFGQYIDVGLWQRNLIGS